MASLLFSHELCSAFLLQVGPRPMASLRVLAAILLVVLLCGLIYLLRRIRSLKVEPSSGGKVPKLRANHILIFLACAAMFAAACVLLFLVANAGSPS